MRALLISDIHANLQALEAVLAAAPAHDAVWSLGDIVGYGANPNEVIEKVRGLDGIVVRGNHDRACSGILELEDFSEAASSAIQWTRGVLSCENREWLRQLPAGPITPDGTEASCVHGSPTDEDEYLLFPEDARSALKAARTRITFFGHTHMQVGFATNGDERFRLAPHYSSSSGAEQYELPLRKSARYILNPGSAGQPRDGDSRAAFALYDDAQTLFSWYRIPYNVRETQRRIRNAGLPEWLAIRLQEGR